MDNLLHHFVECKEMISFWDNFASWWNHICNHCQIDEDTEILLGIKRKKCHKFQLNYLVLQAKWFIYRCKYLEIEVSFIFFLHFLKDKLLLEEVVSKKKKN